MIAQLHQRACEHVRLPGFVSSRGNSSFAFRLRFRLRSDLFVCLFCMWFPTHDLGAPGDAKRTPGLISNVGR